MANGFLIVLGKNTLFTLYHLLFTINYQLLTISPYLPN